MSLAHQMRELVDSVTELVTQHIRLARVELAEDAKFIGTRVGVIAAIAPLIIVGYGLICVALALVLGNAVPMPVAFLIVGLVNVIGGALGIAFAARQLNGRPMLTATASELKASKNALLPSGEQTS